MIFGQKLTDDLCRQIEKTQRPIVGTKMGSSVGNDQNTLLYNFMQKFGIKYGKNMQCVQKFSNDLQCKNILDGFICKKNLETETVPCAFEAQQKTVKQTQ